MPVEEAIKFLQEQGQPYKVELAQELKVAGETAVSFYRSGNLTDLCRGPHLADTQEIGEFKLLSVAGAYWRGDEKNKMLQRIYGTCFATQHELAEYLAKLAEAKKRDHRKLGKELDLFVFSELVGPGLPLYTHRGTTVLNEIIKYSRELQTGIGYQEVLTPNINKAELFKVSGHYEKYKDSMLRVVSNYSEEEYYLKPMNCPQHTQIYASQLRSYRDLPVRIADFANLYRDEKPGELSGLTRLRAFRQDDGHCFCREDQIKQEFLSVLGVIKQALQTYQMDYYVRLSLWDPEHKEKYLGEAAVWEKSQTLLKEILDENKIEHQIGLGEAAIYGPKMDLISRDSLGREWQISTIQLDFIMPQRFGLTYIDADGSQKTPVMIHRAIVEHYGGAFPTWLAPVQAQVVTVSEKFNAYGQKVQQALAVAGLRAELDDGDESLGKKIRLAEKMKVPYILVVGEKEEQADTVSVRGRGQGDLGALSVADFAAKVKEEISKRS